MSRPLDVLPMIEADLRAQRRARARFFAAALALAAALCAAALAALGLRGDLWAQPLAQLALQAGLWLLGLVVLPAIGLGLLFPGRRARAALAAATVLAAIIASADATLTPHGDLGLACAGLVFVIGGALTGLAALSGALARRARALAALWVVAGVSLTALAVVTWHCAAGSLDHWLVGHLGPALLLLLLAGALATAPRPSTP